MTDQPVRQMGNRRCALALMRFSDHLQKTFIIINCAAIPETLLESELFGHGKGASTGADAKGNWRTDDLA